MYDLTLIVIGNTDITIEGIEVLSANNDNIKDVINNAQGKYIVFLSDKDSITENYLEIINEKIKEDFDYCFINYDYSIDKNNKVLKNINELKEIKPYYKEYIFSYIFNTNKLKKLLDIEDITKFNETIDKEFTKNTAIDEIIYFHNPNEEKRLDFIYSDVKTIDTYKNIIYVGSGCNGIFNGYITWIKELGKCYKDKYDIVVLYDEINETTKKRFEKYFKCIHRDINTIYLCDRLLVTYSNYFYPKNIVNLDKNYLFIHGNMSDYDNAMKYFDDIYTNYVAVSKIAALKAKGYFPTETIEYVLNPYKLDEEIPKRMKLTSTLRYTKVKCPERIEKMARLMDELKIPYTWEVFADKKENTNMGGLIYRQRTPNPLPYVKDSDYFVLLSDSESFSYAVLEALSVNTKVVVTPLPVYQEIGVIEDENSVVIPFEYFDDGNEDKLKEIILRMYEVMNTPINYQVNEELQNGYKQIFT
jgi:hypothetical protein